MDQLIPITTGANMLVDLPGNLTPTSGNVNGSGEEEVQFHVPTGLIILLSLLYGSISFVTVIGNALVILVIAKNRQMRTVTNFFIANLSVADVIIGIFGIPFQFQAALLQRWDLPDFLCPVAPFIKDLTVNVSIITLTVISIDRYFAVIHPLRPRCSRTVATVVMVIVWTFSLVSALPSAIVYRAKDITSPTRNITYCAANWEIFSQTQSANLDTAYQLYLVSVQYFFPLIIISYAYIRIMRKVWMTNAPGAAMDTRDQIMNRNKTKVIKMLVIVVALFAFCWLPLQTYNLLAKITAINNYEYIHIIWLCSNLLAMSNSCYNPFIYALLNERYKNGFRSMVPCSSCGKKPQELNHSFSTKYNHEHRPNVTLIDSLSVSPRGRPTQHVHVTVDGKHVVGVSV